MRRMKTLLILLATVLLIILAKMIWVAIMTKDMGSFETDERTSSKGGTSFWRKSSQNLRGL